MRKHVTLHLLSAGHLLLSVGCQKVSEPTPALLDTRWKLEQIGNFPLGLSSYSYDYASYIQFSANESVQGLATCTNFRGKFTCAPASKHLRVGPLTLGTPTCNSPVVAARYLAALPTIVRYEVEATALRLYDAQNQAPQLVFKAVP